MVSGTYNGEELEVTFSARLERSDLGVPGSPVWYEPADPEVEEVVILGVPVPFKSLPLDLQNEIMSLSYEVDEWEE